MQETTDMAKDPTSHQFNSDLLTNNGEVEFATQSYPTISHVLDHPELRDLFTAYDASANTAKKRSRRAGLLAIVLGTFALLSASAEAFSHNTHEASKWLGMVAAIAGVFSVAIGFWGVLHTKSKRQWLCERLMTERLRQFHFQTFVFRLPDIVASLGTSGGAKTYDDARRRWFDEFKAKYEGQLDAELTEILDEGEGSERWLHDPRPIPELVLQADLSEVFQAYKTLRIMRQLQYANRKLNTEASLWPLSLRQQADFLSQTAFICVLALFAIHLVIAMALAAPSLESVSAFAHNPCVHVVTIWCAILALAIRAAEEGLGIRDEIERYRDYRSSIKAIRERFERTTDPAEKLRIMEDMERLSYEEMCSFLRNANDTRFVM